MTFIPELTLITHQKPDKPLTAREAEDVKLVELGDESAAADFWHTASLMLEEYQNLVVIPIDAEISGLLGEIREVLAEEQDDFDALFEELLRRRRPIGRRRLMQAQRNAQAKQELLERYGAYSSSDLAATNSRAKNPAQTAYRWAKTGKIFSVPFQGKEVFPGFQFDEARRPRSVIGAVLPILRDHALPAWEMVFWFTAPTGWLGDKAPVDVLDDEDAVLAAARASYDTATF